MLPTGVVVVGFPDVLAEKDAGLAGLIRVLRGDPLGENGRFRGGPYEHRGVQCAIRLSTAIPRTVVARLIVKTTTESAASPRKGSRTSIRCDSFIGFASKFILFLADVSLVSGKVIGFDTVRHFRFHRQPLICHQHFLAYMVPGIILQHPIPPSASHLIKRLSWTNHGVGKRG